VGGEHELLVGALAVALGQLLRRGPALGVEEREDVRRAVAVGVARLAHRPAVREGDPGVEAPVAVGIALLLRDVAGLVVGLRDAGASAGLHQLERLAVLVLDRDLGLAVAVAVLAPLEHHAVRVGHDPGVDAAVAVLVGLLDLVAARVRAHHALEAAVEVGVLAGQHRPVVGELDDQVRLAVAVGVALGAHLHAVLEDRHLLEALAVAVEVLLDARRPALRVEGGHHVDAAVEVAVLALAHLALAVVLDEDVGLAVAVGVALGLAALEARDDLEAAVAVAVLLLEHELALLPLARPPGTPVAAEVGDPARGAAVAVELDRGVGFAVAVAVAHRAGLLAVAERRHGLERAVAVRVLLLAHRLAVLEDGRDLEAAVAVLVALLAHDRAVGRELAAQVDLPVAVRVLLEAHRHAVLEVHEAVGLPVAVLVLLEAGRTALRVGGAPRVDPAVAVAVGEDARLVPGRRVERDPGVDLAVAAAVLLLLLEPALGVVEVPQVDAPVAVLVEFDAHELPARVVLDALRRAAAGRIAHPPRELALDVLGHRLEAPVEVRVHPLAGHPL